MQIKKSSKVLTIKYDDFNEYFVRAGSICVASDGYALVRIGQKGYQLSKLFVFGFENYDSVDYKNIIVDHKNHDTLDNRMINLRIATKQQNSFNEKMVRKNNTSGFKGVCYDKVNNKWSVSIMYNRKNIKIGRYSDIKEAVTMRLMAELLFCGKDYAPQRSLFKDFSITDYNKLPQRIIMKAVSMGIIGGNNESILSY